ncbi:MULTISPECIES: helix-turn-helix domain-containing protein [Klebsiella]|uniref:helix-turn-helix domain-containing protein n=1 Tax=Klebsiella TaxID=570 RepID=UPI00287CABF0|nr:MULTISPECIES: helix-turn-helix transcriptional regulator [Klebsiella]MDS7756417.1 helix-turn-helix transcriptional regulator [Klebsiella michiganensis]MDS7855669.1 helix-turn-helix transcriptional regulator [Klebsiella michiganensis]MDS7877048.1 helix-turn-helix transcriptional regulator [Klebsiella pasteurii]HBM3090354.1 helix-turn-helix transcriptional regulator [Klebsiella michiganensis]
MALTDFGKAVRKARIDTGYTLLTMAKALGTTPAFLSGLETGTKKIPEKWVTAINELFAEQGYYIDNLDVLASIANESVPIEGLPKQQQMLVAGFAKSEFTHEELKKFAELLAEINKK